MDLILCNFYPLPTVNFHHTIFHLSKLMVVALNFIDVALWTLSMAIINAFTNPTEERNAQYV